MRPLTQQSVAVEVAGAGQAALVIDASQSARSHHREILGLAQHVLGQLPGSVNRTLYFLGNPQAYDPSQLSTRSAQWLQENLGRASLIGPVMQGIEPSAPTKLAILGSGPIFDLEDWVDHPLFARLLLVACGDPLQPAGGPARQITGADQGGIVGFLHDPITSLAVSGPGFLPLWWDNPQYVCEISDDTVRLAAKEPRDHAVRVCFLTSNPQEVRATALMASGGQVDLPLRTVPLQRPQSRVLGELSDSEVRLFHQARERRAYCCPFCGETHAWQELYCTRGGGIFGRRVYESLSDDVTGFVVFRELSSGVQVEVCGEQVLLVDSATAAIAGVGGPALYRFDPENEEWRRDEDARFSQYTRVEDQAYVVLL